MLFPQKVSYFQYGSLLDYITVDGEMSVNCSHNISESLTYSKNHVIDMRLAGVYTWGKFWESYPFGYDNGIFSFNFLFRDLNSEMVKVFD